MTWTILLHEEFEGWLLEQAKRVRVAILAKAGVLGEYGPQLGRPLVDTVQGSRHKNMKELRIQVAGNPWRILFAFDPERQAILLVGGDKSGDKRWYEVHIPIADERFDAHLRSLENQSNPEG